MSCQCLLLFLPVARIQLTWRSPSYEHNCRTTIAFLNDQILPSSKEARQHPLLALAICTVASRAIRPRKYQYFIDESDKLIKGLFSGPAPDLLSIAALMVLAAWTGRIRLWGFIASLAVELKLNESALQLGEKSVEKTQDLIERARLWFSLCCFDLM